MVRAAFVTSVLLSLLSGCCEEVSPRAASTVCIDPAERITAGRPFGLSTRLTTSGGGSFTCTADVDGGVISLTVEGTACRDALGHDIGRVTFARCDAPALPEGTYSFAGAEGTLTLFDGGFSVDGGEPDLVGSGLCF